MTSDEREALQTVCADEQALRDTLADLDASLQPKQADVAALMSTRGELVSRLNAVEEAKEKLAAGVVAPAESEPAQEEFAVPELSETESAKEEEDHG